MKLSNIISCLALFCALLSVNGHAQFSKIIENLEQKNLNMVEAGLDRDQSINTSEAVDSASDVILSTAFEYERGRSPNLFSQFSQESTYLRASLGLSKVFKWGGTLSLVHAYENQDISKWPSSTITSFGGEDAYYLSNTLSYSQDLGQNLFGGTYRSQLRQAELAAKISETNYESIEESSLFQIFQVYLAAKLDKKLLRISKDSLDRAQKRKNLISKRFKDGVAIRADFYKSSNAFNRAKELYREAEVQFEKSLQSLKELVNSEVEKSSIVDYKSYKHLDVVPASQNFLKNKELVLLSQRVMLAKESLREFETQDNFDITLNLSVSRTGLKNNYDDAISNSFDDETFENKAVSLNMVFPLGTTSETYQKINQNLDLKRAEFRKTISMKNIMRNDSILRTELSKVKENLASAQDRLNLERKILKEQNRRYNRGQIDFDQVLTAEESLLGSERTYYQYFTRVLVLGLGINHIYGDLKESLAKYRE